MDLKVFRHLFAATICIDSHISIFINEVYG